MRDYISVFKNTDRLRINSFASGVDYSLDESVMKPTVAVDCMNFRFDNGALRQTTGLKKGRVENALSVWDFTRYDAKKEQYVTVTMFMAEDGKIMYLDPDTLQQKVLGDIVFTSPPVTVNYRLYDEDVIIMCSPTDYMVVWNGVDSAYSVPSSPFISSLAMHYERLFVTTEGEKNAVWFSDDLDPTNWNAELDEGGYITLIDDRGRSNKVISFLNYIYIFRDNGISRLTAYGDQRDFYVGNLFVSSGKIYADTVTVCGDKIYFLASDGIYMFDGVSTQKILSNLDSVIVGGTPFAAYYEGNYYLATRLKGEGRGTENNGLIVISPSSYYLVQGMNITRLCPTSEGLYAALKDGRMAVIDDSGSFFGEPLHKKWVMPKTDFGITGLKILKDLRISSTGKAKITVESDFGKKEVSVNEGVNRFFINLMGHIFGIRIESDCAEISLSRMSLSFKR